jgi:Protein of unknown function (DUF1475)
MTSSLRPLFLAILAAMLAVTGWASLHGAVWAVPAPVVQHPWFIATLADAYCGFITFYAWVWYREGAAASRALWLLAILLLGNIAMASYVLALLARLPRGAAAQQVLLRGEPTPLWIPSALVGALAAVSAVGLLR